MPSDVILKLPYFLGCAAALLVFVVASVWVWVRRRTRVSAQLASLTQLQNLTDRVPGMACQYLRRADGSARFVYVSAGVQRVFGITAQALLQDANLFAALAFAPDRAGLLNSISASTATLTPWAHSYRIGEHESALRWVTGNAAPELLSDGSVLWHGYIFDDTERRRSAEELRVAAIAFDSEEGMFITDAHGTILRVNRAFSRITGYSEQEALGQTPSLLSSGRHDAAFYAGMWRAIGERGAWQGEVWNRRKNGEIFPEWLSIRSAKDDAGAVTHYVSSLTDITQRKAAEAEIQNLAFYDPLTRLPNRRLLLDRLHHALAVNAQQKGHGALLFIDLDHFQNLNDTHGHGQGDLLLQQVARRLVACTREDDTVARLGGDEFVVMLQGLSAHPTEAATRAEICAEKIRSALSDPYVVGALVHHSSASLGIALFSGRTDSVEDLLKHADLALYQAKSAGRNALRFFDPDMQAAMTARAELEADLRRGLREHQLLLHYQPQIDVQGRLTGAEALVRWQQPERGLVPPAQFIPLAEETGMILEIGRWVLETACTQLALWSTQAHTAHLRLAVNVSAVQFHSPDFVPDVLSVLALTGAPAAQLKLELTESVLVKDMDDVVAKMHALKAEGVGFALDDFGTGYSSLSYLKLLPLDQLKIDQSFLHEALSNPKDAAIVRATVALGHSLGLTVIAEGVETQAQRDFLQREGCFNYQGYHFCRPVPVAEMEPFFERK